MIDVENIVGEDNALIFLGLKVVLYQWMPKKSQALTLGPHKM